MSVLCQLNSVFVCFVVPDIFCFWPWNFLICSRMMLAALGVVGVVFVLVSFLLVGILFFVFLVESLILAQDERWRRA